jgi:hypothetical protein
VETGDVVVGVLSIEKIGMMVILFVYRGYCLVLKVVQIEIVAQPQRYQDMRQVLEAGRFSSLLISRLGQ